MKKEKLTLKDLQVKSFVTTLDETSMQQVKGGFTAAVARRAPGRVRWTSVDTRADIAGVVTPGING
jgi:hypothetical protein